jgi:hypothetical protein
MRDMGWNSEAGAQIAARNDAPVRLFGLLSISQP